jgi:hypothetical protein
VSNTYVVAHLLLVFDAFCDSCPPETEGGSDFDLIWVQYAPTTTRVGFSFFKKVGFSL